MRVGLLLAVAAVLVLAGCGLPSGPAGGPTSTVTPASVPNETTPLNLGPPVDRGDSLAPVLDAHRRAVEGAAYRYRASYRGPFPDDPANPRNITLQGFVGANRSVYYLEADYGSGVYRQWSNGSVFVSLRTEDGRRRGGVGDPALPGDSQASQFATGFLFPLEGTTVTRVVRLAEGYRVTARVDRGTRESLFAGSRVPNATIRMVVDPGGRIRAYRLNYTVVHDGTRLQGVEEYVYETGPAVTLPRPAWVGNVLANDTSGHG